MRKLSAILLLMVMMMQLGVKTFHRHHHAESERVTCSDCEHHRVQHSHILSWDGNSSDCIVCQLFSSPFNEVEEICFCAIPTELYSYGICFIADVCSNEQMHSDSRAPPVCLF